MELGFSVHVPWQRDLLWLHVITDCCFLNFLCINKTDARFFNFSHTKKLIRTSLKNGLICILNNFASSPLVPQRREVREYKKIEAQDPLETTIILFSKDELNSYVISNSGYKINGSFFNIILPFFFPFFLFCLRFFFFFSSSLWLL